MALGLFAVQGQAAQPLAATVITGSSVYPPEKLFPVYRTALGRELDPAGTRAILARIQSKYVQDGYLQPKLVLRDDLLNEGILRIDIFEARLTDVQITGQAGPHQTRVSRIRQRLLSNPLLRRDTIAAALKRLRALPGLNVVAATRADASVPNGIILALHLRYQPLTGSVEWSNFGTSVIGPNFISANVTANSLLGGREQLLLSLVSATDYSNYHGIGLTVTTPLNNYGTALMLTGFRSSSEPTVADLSYELAFPTDLATLQVTQRLTDTGDHSVLAYLGYNYNDSIIRYGGIELESDRLRVAQVGLQLDGQLHALPYGATLGIRQGLAAFGAGVSDITGATLPSHYTIATGQLTWAASLDSALTSRFYVLGQWSGGDVLPYEERFKIGNELLARAFKTAEFAGDDGLGAKAELRARLQALSTRYGLPEIFAYSDYGEVWQHDLGIEQHASTAGIGLSWDSVHLTASLEWAKPINVSSGGSTDWAVLGDVTVRF